MNLAEFILGILAAASIPSAITAALIRRSEKKAEQREVAQKEREKKREKLYFMMAKNVRSTHILVKATAKAVQRIPDAHCNGDMTTALAQSDEAQKEWQQFIMSEGIHDII